MGSEILDSSGGARTIAPELVDPRATTSPVVELDELQPVTIEPPPGPEPHTRRRPGLGALTARLVRLKTDQTARRTTIRTVLICLVLMALTASVVQFRAAEQARAERDARVAVDIRLNGVHQSGADAPQGSVTADVQVHNLGPADVTVIALDVMNGGDPDDVVIANDVADASGPVAPGLNRETEYTLQLPCRPSFQLGFGPPQMFAKVRTVDGRVHSLPVNLDTVNEQGGLLTACVQDDASAAPFDYGSVSDGRTVTMTIDVTTAPQMVTLMTPNVGVPVQYVTVPRLPALARPGTTFIVKVTPRVASCSRAPLDLDALQNLGVSIGSQQTGDSYLPVLVAQAAGRACGPRG
jgi:hypothetical protein